MVSVNYFISFQLLKRYRFFSWLTLDDFLYISHSVGASVSVLPSSSTFGEREVFCYFEGKTWHLLLSVNLTDTLSNIFPSLVIFFTNGYKVRLNDLFIVGIFFFLRCANNSHPNATNQHLDYKAELSTYIKNLLLALFRVLYRYLHCRVIGCLMVFFFLPAEIKLLFFFPFLTCSICFV